MRHNRVVTPFREVLVIITACLSGEAKSRIPSEIAR